MTQLRPEKWRPSLGLIIFAVLASVAALPLVGLFFFRLYDNQLIHQTQAELIAQTRYWPPFTRARWKLASTSELFSAQRYRRVRVPIRRK